MSVDGGNLRSWGGTFAQGLAFPLGAVAAAVPVFATEPLSAGLGLALVGALVPWALVVGDVRIRPWVMVLAGVVVPGVIVVAFEAPGAIFLALLATAWLAATGGSRAAEAAAVVATVVVLPVLIPFTEGDNWNEHRPALFYFATGSLITWLFGRILRRERRLVAALRDAQERLEAAAAAEERQRIARDVHDVVGHSLTVMLLNVSGARRVLPRDPDAAAEALDRAERVGRDSLQNVRSIVGLLRTPGETEAGPPQPGAGDITGLVRTAEASGLPVRVEVEGDLDGVDPYAGLAAYRIVQEAISNVQHHAPAAEVLVRVVRDGERLVVSVRNGPGRAAPAASPASSPDGTVRRSGTGLVGMRQRVAAVGGTVSVGPDGDGWLVEGTIPLRRADAAEAGR